MAGQLNKIHAAPQHEKSQQIFGNMQRSNFPIGRHDA
jgi:hypothetical protein